MDRCAMSSLFARRFDALRGRSPIRAQTADWLSASLFCGLSTELQPIFNFNITCFREGLLGDYADMVEGKDVPVFELRSDALLAIP